MEEIDQHINEQGGEIKEMFTAYSINEHSVQFNRAID